MCAEVLQNTVEQKIICYFFFLISENQKFAKNYYFLKTLSVRVHSKAHISVVYPDPDLFPRSIIICCGSGKNYIINIGPRSVCFYFTILVPSVLKPPIMAEAVKKGAAPALQLKLQL